ncbi:MAG: DUF5696 domain-containing protein [Candidatus Thermoplasmatota archaeon]|nr:DUF5696 domain-containing protein [Candidatus Thermoplasmatota archaeon]
MKKSSKALACLFLTAGMLSSAFAAIDEVNVVTTFINGSKSEKVHKLEKIGKSTYRLKIPADQLKSCKENGWRPVDYVEIKRDEATAQKGEDGYWVLADGRLGKFDKEKGNLTERRNPMPLYGVKKGDDAFVGIVKELKYEFATVVDVKDGKYEIYPRFLIKEIYMKKPYEDIVIDFTHFKGKAANYSSMGREYRKYQLDRGEVRPLRERVVGNPTLKYTADAIFLKFMMASFMRDSETHTNRGDHWKPEDDPAIQKYRSFDDMKEIFKKLKALGIDKADIILTNWNWRSNGRNPMCSVAEPELGGNAKCKEATKLGKELGYQISPHILHTENYTISPYFCKNDIAVDQNGQYKGYTGMGGKGFNPSFIQVYRKHILDNYDRMKKLGFNGPMHIDVTSAITPYNDFNIDHFATRKDTAEYMNKVGFLSDAFFGAWTSEGPCDQVANTLDYALYVSAYPSYLGSKHPLMDRCVPIWEIAYHGIILYNPFASTIDYNLTEGRGWGPTTSFTPETRRLKLVEFGGRPTFYWALANMKDFTPVKKAYDEYQPLKYLQYEFMDFHGEIAPGVFLTKYSDGSRIVTNYTQKAYNYNGRGIVKPMDYMLIKAPAKPEAKSDAKDKSGPKSK